jgi:hypothetical protein
VLRLDYEPGTSVLLCGAAGPLDDGMIAAYRRTFLQLDQDSLALQRTPVTILVVAPDAQRPNANQRRQFAEVWGVARAPLHLVALVTSSAIDRGILRAIAWLHPPGSGRRESVHATFESAAEWAARERGEAIPGLSERAAGLFWIAED